MLNYKIASNKFNKACKRHTKITQLSKRIWKTIWINKDIQVIGWVDLIV
jgi:hypothetical protein